MESAMSMKRPFHGDDGLEVFVQEAKRRHMWKNSVVDVMKAISSDEIVVRMEPVIRKVVREEVERVIRACLHPPNARPSFSQVETSERRGFQLLFMNKLPSPIFTGSRIEAEDGGPVIIQLVDANTKTVVKTGPYSSIKIEIVVLDGDFCSDDHEDWSEKEFKAKVIREREGKRPLVTGELNVTLREGVGALGDIVFTDNSSWMRCRKFRLGARVLQRSGGDVRIREGRSEAFVVKDHRGELYKKHYPPSLDDEIWRLEKIAKDGAFHERLAANQVNTVRDFLRWLTTDPTSLRTMLGGPTRTWSTIVEHATTCVIDDDKCYFYYGEAEGSALLLNPIYQLAAATFDGKNYLPIDKLTFAQKLLVENIKKRAYKHVNDFVQIDAANILGPSRTLRDLHVEPFNSPTSILQFHEFPLAPQEMQLDFNHASASTSFAHESSNQFQLSLAQNTPATQGFNPAFKNSFTMAEIFSPPYNEENSWSSGGSQGQMVASTSNLAIDQMSTWSPVNGTWGQGNFIFSASNDSELGIVSPVPDFSVNSLRTGQRNAAARFKIRAAGAAVMCVLLLHNLARSRKARLFYLHHY